MKKNIDPKTAQLFEATKNAFNASFSTVIRPKGVYKVCPSDIENIGHNINLRKRIAEAEKAVEETNEYCLKKRAKERLQSLKKLKFRDVSGFIVDDNIDWYAVVEIMDGYSCGLASLPRIMRELATMCGERVFLEASPVEDGTEATEVETVTEAAPAAPDFAEVLASDAAAMPLALPAITESAIIEQAARIKAAHEALKAEAEREQSAAAFAEAITAYCEELSRPEPLAWVPETIILPFEPRPAAEVEQPRRRHRLNLRPRLSRWLHPARWVAVAFVVCLLSGLLLGMNTSTATDAETVVQVIDLPAVTVTADAPDTLIEDKAPAPSPVKKLAAPSPVKNAAADAVTLPGQKTADDMATATAPAADSDGLTICAGTAWAYTMMNWA